MRLIDADVLDSVVMLHNSEGGNITRNDYKRISALLIDFPTVDAVPVRHGKWIDEGYYADNTNVKAWHCSECNWHMLRYDDELFRYCPTCGARMDAERKEE